MPEARPWDRADGSRANVRDEPWDVPPASGSGNRIRSIVMSFDPLLATTAMPVAGLMATSLGPRRYRADRDSVQDRGSDQSTGIVVIRLDREIGGREFRRVRVCFLRPRDTGRAP